MLYVSKIPEGCVFGEPRLCVQVVSSVCVGLCLGCVICVGGGRISLNDVLGVNYVYLCQTDGGNTLGVAVYVEKDGSYSGCVSELWGCVWWRRQG